MGQQWFMEPVFITIPGMQDIIIHVPGHGVSIGVIIPGMDGVWAMLTTMAGLTGVLVTVGEVPTILTGVAAAVAGGVPAFISLLMFGILTDDMAIMAVTFTGTIFRTAAGITTEIFTGTEPAL